MNHTSTAVDPEPVSLEQMKEILKALEAESLTLWVSTNRYFELGLKEAGLIKVKINSWLMDDLALLCNSRGDYLRIIKFEVKEPKQ